MTDLAAEDDERMRRLIPGGGEAPELSQPMSLMPKLVAPNAPGNSKDRNTFRLMLKVEVRVVVASVDDEGTAIKVPIKKEPVHLYAADGTVLEGETDDDGVAAFNDVPLLMSDGVPRDDIFRPAVVLPAILEEWINPNDSPPSFTEKGTPLGVFGKNYGESDDYRKGDRVVHFVPALQPKVEIELSRLTEEQKFQYFRWTFESNNAHYARGQPHDYDGAKRRFRWGVGSVCNQHINFFLSFWYNLAANFHDGATSTTMATLCTYNSEMHTFGTHGSHRSFTEFLEMVSAPLDGTSIVWNSSPPPAIGNTDGHYRNNVEYILLGSKYFTRTGIPGHFSYAPTTAWGDLVASLADFNVYSLSFIPNFPPDNQMPNAKAAVAAWAHTNPGNSHHATHASVLAMNEHALTSFLWNLDDNDPLDQALISALRNHGNITSWDHHAGIIVKRGANGVDPRIPPSTGAAPVVELWNFPADGTTSSPKPIVLKSMTDRTHPAQLPPLQHPIVMDHVFAHIAIWKLAPLRAGGFMPLELANNDGGLSIDEPPRFIHWGTAVDPAPKRAHRKTR